MTSPRYAVVNREVVVSSADAGGPLWSGMPLGVPVEEVVPLPGTDDAVVLLDYSAMPAGPARNLARITPRGEVSWLAELPTTSSTEAYVSLEVKDSRISANSWTGHWVVLDPASGRIRESEFVK